ncbi:TonB-dependent receptor [Candidatus Foliamicus sp.]
MKCLVQSGVTRSTGIRVLLASVLAAVTAVPYSLAQAQDEALEEIVVTVRKRSEALQEVPLSVVAFGNLEIEQQKISNLDDLARLTPGFTMDDGFGYLDARPAIRGQSNIRGASQPTLGVLVDGIDLPFRSGLNGETLDIERIEVVKGPQSAMFGRGVLSGAINYVTRRPELDRTSGYIEAEGATDGLYEARGRVNLPLGPGFAMALSARYSDAKGFYKNNLTGEGTVGGHEFGSAVVAALWEAGEDFSAYLRVSYSDELREQPQRHIVPSNTQTGARASQVWFIGAVEADPDRITHNCDHCVGLDRQFTRASLDLEWDVGFGTISSVTGITNTDIHNDQDSDFEGLSPDLPAGPPLFNNLRQIILRDISTLSQELRLASPDGDRFSWLVGGYYYNQENDEQGQSRVGIFPNEIVPPFTVQSDETETLAVFGQASYDLTDQFSVSAEYRWSRDELSSNGTRNGEPFPLDETFENNLPRFTADYDLSSDLMLYAAIAKGSKPGGFNTALGAGTGTLPLELIAFDEEKAWSYEAGLKSTWLDGDLTVNAAAFYVDWTNIQIDDQFANPDGTTLGYTSNAGKAEVKGFEVSIDASLTDSVDVALGYSHNPARVFDSQDSRAFRAGIITTGESHLPFSSDRSLTAALRIRGAAAGGWDWYAQLDGRYDSTQYATTANLAETGSRFFANLRAGLDNEAWSIQGYVTNLLDNDNPVSIQPFVNAQNFRRQFLVTVVDPLQAGIRVRRNF